MFLNDYPTVIIGTVGFAFWIWTWRGRSPAARSWMMFPVIGDIVVLMSFPIMALLPTGAMLTEYEIFLWVSVPMMFSGFIPMIWGFPILCIARFYWPAQQLWGPSWYTTLSKEQVEELVLSQRDILTVGAQKQPTWAGRNLDYWYGIETTPGVEQEFRKGHLWLAEHGIYFDPKNMQPAGVTAARARWDAIHDFTRTGCTITLTFTKYSTEETHTFRMPLLRARRVEKQITAIMKTKKLTSDISCTLGQ